MTTSEASEAIEAAFLLRMERLSESKILEGDPRMLIAGQTAALIIKTVLQCREDGLALDWDFVDEFIDDAEDSILRRLLR